MEIQSGPKVGILFTQQTKNLCWRCWRIEVKKEIDLIGITLFYYPNGIADPSKERYVVTIRNIVQDPKYKNCVLFEITFNNMLLFVPSHKLTTGSKEELLLWKLEN
jgi:hypothetical protein